MLSTFMVFSLFMGVFCINGILAEEVNSNPGEAGKVVLKQTALGTFALYVPKKPRDILILVHGYPWPDGSRTMSQLADHVANYANRWRSFADEQHLVLLVPAFGSAEFLGYRELFGQRVDADEFVNLLVDEYGHALIENFEGKFYLYGHSAGGQFASRYAVVHPERLKKVVLSAPGRYAFPDPDLPWPYGMEEYTRQEMDSGTPETGKDPQRSAGTDFKPELQGWLLAATTVPIAIIIGSNDVDLRVARPGHPEGTRIDYAKKWMNALNLLADQQGGRGPVALAVVEGVAHDPVALIPKAQESLLAKD